MTNERSCAPNDANQITPLPCCEQLFLQFDDGDRLSAAIFGFGADDFDQRMRFQKFGEASAQRAGAVAVDQAHLRGTRERGLIEKLVHAARGFLDRAANEIDFSPAGFGGGLRAHA